ncbi:hypothetical protein [Alteribacter populi]|uniref:hypothetical protein n=1 Tax=Alteribacter populi TaxID=2011011 RepID=UPI000BBA934F|nr:hypothetical protein [Alteribacter populi]
MKMFPKNLPEDILISILDESSDYFTLATISYYMSSNNRKYKYKNLKKQINKILLKKLNEIEEFIKHNSLKDFLLSKDFYFVHDFASSTLLFKETKEKLKEIQDQINAAHINFEENGLYNFFLDFIKEHPEPFMRWNADEKTIAREFFTNSLVQSSGY